MQRSPLCRSRRELSNAYLLAKFGFDTAGLPASQPAENDPCKVCPDRIVSLPRSSQRLSSGRADRARGGRGAGGGPRAAREGTEPVPSRDGVPASRERARSGHGMRQTLQGSFSAVSKPNFARKYAFESSRRDLHNALLCTALKSHLF